VTIERVVIVGTGGAGKTTLARALADHIGGEVVALDTIAWKQRRRVPDDVAAAELCQRLEELDRWVVDGTLPDLLSRTAVPLADQVIWLDTPRGIAARRVLRRGAAWLPAAVHIVVFGGRVGRQAARLLGSPAVEGRRAVRLSSTAEIDAWLSSQLA
jgi:adenylate kinase family enzyme